MSFLAAQYSEKLGYTTQQDRLLLASLFNPGVIGQEDLLASAATGYFSQVATGMGVVPNTNESTGGSYVITNIGGAENVLHPIPDPSNSRLDTLYIKVYDSTDGGDASDGVLPVVVQGTPQTGNPNATTLLSSRAGVGSAPGNALLISDVYVPASAASAASFTYRDRRPWARGANVVLTGANLGSGDDYNTTSTSLQAIDPTNLQARIECSGYPITFVMDFHYAVNEATGPVSGIMDIEVDGSQLDGQTWRLPDPPVTLSPYHHSISYTSWESINAGSHVFTWRFALGAGTAFYVAASYADKLAHWHIYEDLRLNANNGTS